MIDFQELLKAQRFHSFVWGVTAALLVVLPGGVIISHYGFSNISTPIAEYIGVIIFTASVGAYFGRFWKSDDDSVASVLGFLLVLMATFIVFSYQKTLIDSILAVSFLFGFEFVVSGRFEKSDKLNKSLRNFLSKTSWYIFSFELMASFELPLFQKIINFKVVNLEELSFIVGLGALYVLFVLYVHYYIDKETTTGPMRASEVAQEE